MEEELEQEAELRRYLLGGLTLEEQVLIGQRLFLDSDYARLAQSVQDDLIDDYVHDELTAAERKEFEKRFLNQPEYRDEIGIAQALDRYLAAALQPAADLGGDGALPLGTTGPAELRSAEREAGEVTGRSNGDHTVTLFPARSRRDRFLRLALAAGVLIVLSVIAWSVFQSTRKPAGEQFRAGGPESTPAQSVSPQHQPGPSVETAGPGGATQPNKTPANERDRPQPERQSAVSFATVTIFPGAGTRSSGQSNEVQIPAGTTNLLVQLPVVTVKDYDKYHFELLTGGRALIVRNLNVSIDKTLGRMVSFIVPTKFFTQKNYEIRLRGITGDGQRGESTTYAFTVSRQQ